LVKRRVVVTGLGVVTPLGLDLEENWQKALAGVSAIGRLTLAGMERFPIQAVGAVSDENWKKIKSGLWTEATAEGERRTLFALWAAQSAFSDAGLFAPAKNHLRFGVCLAAGLGIWALEDLYRWALPQGRFDVVSFSREFEQVSRESMIRNLSNRPAALIARRWGFGGLNCTITSACASATQAIGLAGRAIQRGEADVVLAGGADSMIHSFGLVGFALLQAAASGPHARCRPFDRKRSGLIIGEGAGIAVLEEQQHALQRGARIYAELAGYGSSMDAYQVTAPHPRGDGAARCMRVALKDAELSPNEIDYINAHGTGTKLNDLAETMAIKEVFRETAREIPISSSKSMIGHLMAASGAPEFVFTVLSVQRDEIHPTINLENPDPKCDLDYVPNVKRSRRVAAALSNSFGFGGQNASIVVKKYSHASAPVAT
jgi:3-oxoacyl-[acyl-carrier-protein] synthase II